MASGWVFDRNKVSQPRIRITSVLLWQLWSLFKVPTNQIIARFYHMTTLRNEDQADTITGEAFTYCKVHEPSRFRIFRLGNTISRTLVKLVRSGRLCKTRTTPTTLPVDIRPSVPLYRLDIPLKRHASVPLNNLPNSYKTLSVVQRQTRHSKEVGSPSSMAFFLI